ncbi:hypothetical protein NW762_012880 [Fusarium torreyae]|uniref:Uncharacterized protein n=1 Tax=Fusarium torreyae TaxID=1237075 RepID=A0A9W8V982_9HYPO|nr:hypothetical protein NW762_012880 [Fusarium torreyae]
MEDLRARLAAAEARMDDLEIEMASIRIAMWNLDVDSNRVGAHQSTAASAVGSDAQQPSRTSAVERLEAIFARSSTRSAQNRSSQRGAGSVVPDDSVSSFNPGRSQPSSHRASSSNHSQGRPGGRGGSSTVAPDSVASTHTIGRSVAPGSVASTHTAGRSVADSASTHTTGRSQASSRRQSTSTYSSGRHTSRPGSSQVIPGRVVDDNSDNESVSTIRAIPQTGNANAETRTFTETEEHEVAEVIYAFYRSERLRRREARGPGEASGSGS